MKLDWKKLEREYWRGLEDLAPDEGYRRQYRAFRLASEFKGLSKNQQRDFDFYLGRGRKERCYPSFTCPPSPDRMVLCVPTVEHWFWLWDTHGIECGCDQPKDAGAIVQAKAFLNLSINLWVEDILGNRIGHTLAPEDLDLDALPWVRKDFQRRLKRGFLTSPQWGWIPTFAQPFLV